MGVTACLAYMFIDLERYEVKRGHKAVHNPLKGQGWRSTWRGTASRCGVPLLIAATVGNDRRLCPAQPGTLRDHRREPGILSAKKTREPAYIDFLAYALIHLLRHRGCAEPGPIATCSGDPRTSSRSRWPASTLLIAFKTFFTFVMLQQIFASIRQGKLLVETIADFWSPHESIHERARNALPQYGALCHRTAAAVAALRRSLTREQREQLPLILARSAQPPFPP